MYGSTASFTFQFKGDKRKELTFSLNHFPAKGVENKHRCFKIFKVQTKLHDAQECAVAFLCLSME